MNSAIFPPLFALRPLADALIAQGASLERLATGVRINRAADDPAGLISSSSIRAVLSVLEAETRALERADSVASVADGAYAEISSMLRDAEGLAVQAANSGALSDAERDALQLELDSLAQGIDRIAATTSFGDTPVFDGDAILSTGAASFQIDALSASTIGAVEVDGETYTLQDVVTGGGADLATNPELASRVISAAASDVATRRGALGAFQANTIEPHIATNATTARELSSALSIIVDTDYAAESSALTRAMILADSSLATLVLSKRLGSYVYPLLAA